MKKIFRSKFFIAFIALAVCVTSSCVVLANVKLPQTVNITVDYDGTPIQDDFYGVGQNQWNLDLSDDSRKVMDMTEAHSDLNQKRLSTVSTPIVRVMVMPHYLTFHETEEDNGEAKWNAGELNFESNDAKALIHQLKMYHKAGTEVYLHWGYAVIPEVEEWFVMKDAITISSRERGAPENLEAFGKNLIIFLNYCTQQGIDNISTIGFYNESHGGEFGTLGDKRQYSTKMLYYVDKYMREANIRDNYKIMGLNGGTQATFTEDWGANVTSIDMGETGQMGKYWYENCLTDDGKRIVEGYDFHVYERKNTRDYGRYLDVVSRIVKYMLGGDVWIGEFGPLSSYLYNNETNYIDIKGVDEDLIDQSTKNGYRVSWAGMANALMNSGAQSGLSWYYYGGIVTSPVGWSCNLPADVDKNGIGSTDLMWNNPAAGSGVDGVSPTFGEMGMIQRYLPNHAKILKSTSSSEDVRVAVATTQDSKDITYFVELNDNSGKKTINIDLGNYNNKTFKKYVYKYPKSLDKSECKTDEELGSWVDVDANALLPAGEDVSSKISGSILTDEFDDWHYMVVYSTLDEAPQVYFEDADDVEIEIAQGNGNNATLSTIKTRGLNGNTDVEYSVLTNYDAASGTKTDVAKATIDQSGKITLTENAKVGDFISIKVASKVDGAEEAGGYAISLVKVTEAE